ncbi:11035_t:CDS:2, partial [Funneliformis geosporum]
SIDNKYKKEQLIKNYGIKGTSKLLEIKALKFPWSFPIDIMHFFFKNIAPLMFAYWSQKFFKNNSEDSNIYKINNSIWEEIGNKMKEISKNMPLDIGRLPQNIYKHYVGFKAVEWRNWITLFSLPLLNGKLDKRYLLRWNKFVKAVELCLQYIYINNDLNEISDLLNEFYFHYEK